MARERTASRGASKLAFASRSSRVDPQSNNAQTRRLTEAGRRALGHISSTRVRRRNSAQHNNLNRKVILRIMFKYVFAVIAISAPVVAEAQAGPKPAPSRIALQTTDASFKSHSIEGIQAADRTTTKAVSSTVGRPLVSGVDPLGIRSASESDQPTNAEWCAPSELQDSDPATCPDPLPQKAPWWHLTEGVPWFCLVLLAGNEIVDTIACWNGDI